jgi:hypothetical protein
MSFQNGWLDDWRDAARGAEAARYYHRGPDGRVVERIFLNKPPRGAAPAAQWERLCEVAHSTKHADIEADRLDGLMIGTAFIKHVIKDPKVKACGAWLCLEYPEFGPLFSVGVFEGIKENSPYGPPVIFRRDKWPVLQVDLCSDFARVASRGECHDYMAAPEERSNSLSHTAQAIADRHAAFFDLLRNSELIAEGVSESLFTQAIPADQWNRPDRYLDIALSDLLCIEPTISGFSSRRILNGVKLRLPPALKPASPSASIETIGSRPAAKEKALPIKRGAVIKVLLARGIRSKSDLASHSAPSRLAAEIAGDVENWGTGRDRVEALRVMFTRLTDADFAVK